MEAAASKPQHTFGQGPQGLNPGHGAQQAPGPHRRAAQGIYGAQVPSEQHQQPQQHPKPFFYVQPSQPYLPLQNMQWHVPVSYNSYYGYMGYAMPPVNPFQVNVYMEPPSYVLPQTHLHLMDYRRMLNPQYYQTLAYHSRRFRYQHNAPGREMVSSEVQTEPLSVSEQSGSLAGAVGGAAGVGGSSEAHYGLPDCKNKRPDSSGPAQPPTRAVAVKVDDGLLGRKEKRSSSVARGRQKSSFVIQTEEVRIECCSTPVGIEVVRSRETKELALAHSYSQDRTHRGSTLGHSPALLEAGACAPAELSDDSHRACPDILIVGTASCGSTEEAPSLGEAKTQIKVVGVSSDSGSRVEACVEAHTRTPQGQRCDRDATVSRSSDGAHLKVLHMPFDLDYLDELRSMETTVWSMEDTCVPSDWLTQNALIDSHMGTLTAEAEVPFADKLNDSKVAPMEQVVPMVEMPYSVEDPSVELDPTTEAPEVALASVPTVHAITDVIVPEVAPMSHMAHATEVSHLPGSQLADSLPSVTDVNHQELEISVQSHAETSFESLPAYLSTTRLPADLGNVYHCNTVPPTPQELSPSQSVHASEAPGGRQRLNLEPHASQRPKAERCKGKIKGDRRSVSDHECCVKRTSNENAFTPWSPGGKRLCTRCLANHGSCRPVSPGLESQLFQGKSVPLQPWHGCPLPTCEVCEEHTKRRLTRRRPNSDFSGPFRRDDAEGETTSENSSCRMAPKWRGPDEPWKRRRSPRNQADKCPVALYPKLREKNCACRDHRVPEWEGLRRHPRGNAIQEMNEENLAVPYQDKWGIMENGMVNWQTERPFKGMAFYPDNDGSKNGATTQHLNKQKKSQPLSQGTHRKDTRC